MAARAWYTTKRKAGPVVLDAAGLVCLTVAASTISATLGWAAAGLGLFVMNWQLRG